MAAGDLEFFEEGIKELVTIHILGTDDFRWALVSDATPALDTATPTLSDFTQVAAGGNYVQVGAAGSATGKAVTLTWNEAGGTCTSDGDDVSWAQDPSNPTTPRWALLVNNASGKNNAVLARVDLGSTFDMTTGDLDFAVPSLFTLAAA